MHIALEDPAQADVTELLARGETYMAGLYPAESNHTFAVESLKASNVLFYVARDEAGRAVGTGAVVLNGTWAEIKRMWVEPECRGRSCGEKVLAVLEAAGLERGIDVLRLETGVRNHAALGLYTKAGYRVRGPFAAYRHDPLSVFMEKALGHRLGQIESE